MNCHYCGAELKEGLIFCGNCGTRRAELPEPRRNLPEEKPAQRVMPPAESVRPAYIPFGGPARTAVGAPAVQLPTRRSLAKMFFLGILTLGIYPMTIWFRLVTELNIAASRYDGERTMSCFGVMVLTPITLGIYPIVWIHGLCHRIGAELKRRELLYEFGASTFWLWNVLGALILVGPFIFTHKLMKSMNLINSDFNVNG